MPSGAGLEPQQFTVTSLEDWARADIYNNERLLRHDEDLRRAVERAKKEELPDIAVSPAQGKFLSLLARSIGAKRILEVGTLGGYSTIWLAKALPDDGELVTFELLEKHAQVARENIASAGLADKVQVVVGPAIDNLRALQPDVPFDLVFIDADKPSNVDYFREAKRLVRNNGVIIVDNVVRWGKVANLDHTDVDVEGVRALLAALKDDKDVDAVVMGTAGEKGYDGFLYGIVKKQ
ncbi:hypothetical protein AX16_003377 [Volvariella volvacea WC 439]|nr:hypothetical protein AX16_003377 [Volvariella volvacea WC 439]